VRPETSRGRSNGREPGAPREAAAVRGTIRLGRLAARPGQIVVMPAHVPHAVHVAQPFKVRRVLIRG
jgi:hypothetical protein